MLFTFLIVLASQALVIQAGLFSHKRAADDVGALCAGKPIDLTTLEELQDLGGLISLSSCSDHVKQAIPEMIKLISEGKNDLCSAKSIDALKQFYAEYLDTSTKELKKKDQLPESLRRFALAYGLQMSNLCRKHMVQVLIQDGSSLFHSAGSEKLEDLIEDNGPVAEVLGAAGTSPDEVFMPGDLAPLIKKRANKSDDKLLLQTAAGKLVKEVQSVCLHRFKPIYAPLMVPLTRLANMGFNYKDKVLKADLKSRRAAEQVIPWARIVFLCEALNTIHIVQLSHDDKSEEEEEDDDDSKVQEVRILTKEEAAAMGDVNIDASAQEEPELEDFVYEPSELVRLVGPVYNKDDAKLVKAVKAFATSRTEEEVLKQRMLEIGKSLAISHLKKGHIGLMLSSAYKGIVHRNSVTMNPSEQMVKSLYEMYKGVDKSTQRISVHTVLEITFATVAVIAIITYVTCLIIFGSVFG